MISKKRCNGWLARERYGHRLRRCQALLRQSGIKLIGVLARKRGFTNEPDGFFLPPPKPRLHDFLIKKRNRQILVYRLIPSRLSMLIGRFNNERGVCFFSVHNVTELGQGLLLDFSAGTCLLHPPMKKGKVDLYTNSMVRKWTADEVGKATGVSFLNKEDIERYKLKSRVVVLGAFSMWIFKNLWWISKIKTFSGRHRAQVGEPLGRYLHGLGQRRIDGNNARSYSRERYNEMVSWLAIVTLLGG